MLIGPGKCRCPVSFIQFFHNTFPMVKITKIKQIIPVVRHIFINNPSRWDEDGKTALIGIAYRLIQ